MSNPLNETPLGVELELVRTLVKAADMQLLRVRARIGVDAENSELVPASISLGRALDHLEAGFAQLGKLWAQQLVDGMPEHPA